MVVTIRIFCFLNLVIKFPQTMFFTGWTFDVVECSGKNNSKTNFQAASPGGVKEFRFLTFNENCFAFQFSQIIQVFSIQECRQN